MRPETISQEVTVTGRVQVAAYDLDGSILAVDVKTSEGHVYLIDDNRKGTQLLKFVGLPVVAKGVLRKEGGDAILSVLEFRPMAN